LLLHALAVGLDTWNKLVTLAPTRLVVLISDVVDTLLDNTIEALRVTCEPPRVRLLLHHNEVVLRLLAVFFAVLSGLAREFILFHRFFLLKECEPRFHLFLLLNAGVDMLITFEESILHPKLDRVE